MSASRYLTMLAWQFSPRVIRSIVSLWLRMVGGNVPPSHILYAQIYHRVLIGVVCLSFLYHVGAKYYTITQTPNLYDVFSLPPNCTDRDLRVGMKKISLRYHPDKAGGEGIDVFLQFRAYYDALADPKGRHYYDRLGPSILDPASAEHRRTEGMLINVFLMKVGQFYGLRLLSVVGLSYLLGYGVTGWWGALLTITICTLEFLQVTGSAGFLDLPLTGSLLVFEQVALMREVLEWGIGALFQLGLKAPPHHTPCTQAELEAGLDGVLKLSAAIEQEALVMQDTEFMPFAGDDGALKGIEEKMTDWMVEQRVRNTPIVRVAMNEARKKR